MTDWLQCNIIHKKNQEEYDAKDGDLWDSWQDWDHRWLVATQNYFVHSVSEERCNATDEVTLDIVETQFAMEPMMRHFFKCLHKFQYCDVCLWFGA